MLSSLTLFALVGASVASPVLKDASQIKGRTACATGISTADREAVVSAFESSGVVPDLIPSIEPTVKVDATYGSKAVNLGNEFTTLETVKAPDVSFTAESGKNPDTTGYSFFLVDPDVPNAGATGLSINFLHEYIAHVQPCGVPSSPQTVTLYEPLTPASTQQHRYTFLVYREPAGYEPDVVGAQLRPGFDLNAYTAAAGLEVVGGNFLREGITNGIVPAA